MNEPSTQRMNALASSVRHPLTYFQQSGWMAHGSDADACDFAFGNPHDMAMPAYVEALREAAIPRDPAWFAYKMS